MICDISLQFWLLFKCFCQLSHMKTNWSTIPSPIAKPIKTFLDWVTTSHFARFVYTQCKHHFSSYLFTLHKDNIKLSPYKSLKKKKKKKNGNRIWHFCFFSAQPFGTGSLQTFSFFSHNFQLFQYKFRLRVKVPKYNCNFHFWVMNVILKVTRRQWHYHYEIYKQTMKFS